MKILPEDDEYKPHMAIRCECFGSFFLYPSIHKQFDSETIKKMFSQKILIGTSTIKSIGDFYVNQEELNNFLKSHSNRNCIHSIDSFDNTYKLVAKVKQKLLKTFLYLNSSKSNTLFNRKAPTKPAMRKKRAIQTIILIWTILTGGL